VGKVLSIDGDGVTTFMAIIQIITKKTFDEIILNFIMIINFNVSALI